MSDHVAGPHYSSTTPMPGLREMAGKVSGYWWVLLLTGIAWIAAALVILQFNSASVTTVGVIIGILFAATAVQNFVLASVVDRARWVWVLFGILFVAAAVICFSDPATTFAGLADVLGFLFLIVGIWWMVQAFMERTLNPLWWMTLIAGILMTIMAFWTSGQIFMTKVYVLLVFAGVWALMQGVTDIARAFAARQAHEDLT
jgi:uncharacterized membrane protein HdeD (DUF308 family)